MKQFVVDAFTDKVFSGNPAAVCILDNWLSEDLLLKITKENNLSETAFAVRDGNAYDLRWFTPGGEIDLCGHATLATAFVITQFYDKDCCTVVFNTKSGILVVTKKDDLFEMDFPAYDLKPVDVSQNMIDVIGAKPVEAFIGRDLLCIFDSEEIVRNLKPDMAGLLEMDGLLLQVSAPGREYDCVSRSFAPKLNVSEDPVCGSGHCHIIPYFSGRLGKKEIRAYQASERGGVLYCKMNGTRVILAGKAVLFSEAEINIY